MQKEDCDIDDDRISSVSDMNSSDGLASLEMGRANKPLLKKLGARLDPSNVNPVLSHRAILSLKVVVFLDACHMDRLVRKCPSTCKTPINAKGE